MKLRTALMALLLAVVAGIAVAHGDKPHVIGTLQKISSDSIVVKTKDGKSVEVKLVASTRYILHPIGNSASPTDASQDKPAKHSDLAVGDAVVIHTTPKDNTLEADEVRFSVPVAGKTAAPAAAKPKS